MALLLVDELVEIDPGTGDRLAITRALDEVATIVRRRLDAHPAWAKAFQEPGGEAQLAQRALELLASLGLVRREAGHRWRARPALCRYGVDTGGML